MEFSVFNTFFLIVIIWNAIMLIYLTYKRGRIPSIFPDIKLQRIIYKESFASGLNLDAKLKGHFSRCLKLVVTDSELWLTSFYPFTLFIDKAELEHRIVRSEISLIENEKHFLHNVFTISFTDKSGQSQRIRIIPSNAKQFAKAIDFDGII